MKMKDQRVEAKMTATVETAVDSPPHSTPHHHHHHHHNPAGGSSRRGSYFSNKLKSSSNRSFSNLSSHSNMVMGCWQKPMSGKSGSSSTDGLDVDHTQNSSPARTVSPRSNERGLSPDPKPDELPEILTDIKSTYAYRRGRLIGKGGFAKVYEVTDLTVTGAVRVYADKVINKEVFAKRTSKDKVKREIMLHKDLSHPNVVQFHKWFYDASTNVHIILEYCAQRSLLHVMKARKVLTEPEVRYYMLQICDGVKYIHSKDILHRDLKLGNMFLTADMTLKIGDFGLATTLQGDRDRGSSSGGGVTLCGTPNYIAPEVLRKEGHGVEADIWALGCMMFAMLVGTPPFETKSLTRTYAKIAANDYEIPSRLSQPAHDLISTMLHPDPCRRGHLIIPPINQGKMDLIDLMAHSFFTRGFCPTKLPISCTSHPPKFPLEKLYPSNQSLSDNKALSNSNKPSSPSCSTDTDSGCSGISLSANNSHRNPTSATRAQPNLLHRSSAGVYALRQRFNRLFPRPSERHAHQREHLLIQIIEAATCMDGSGVCGSPTLQGSSEKVAALSLLPVFVSKWIDYSNKYGFGYQLSDNSIGVIFNDQTRICQSPDGSVCEYIDHRSKVQTFPSYSPPADLATRVRLVQYFHRYMDENLAEGVTSSLTVNQMTVTTKHRTLVPQVVRWIRNNSTVIMELNNSSIQINFIKDHAKLIFWGTSGPESSGFMVTYLSSDRAPLTYSLRLPCRAAIPAAIENKISQAIEVLKELTEKLLDKLLPEP